MREVGASLQTPCGSPDYAAPEIHQNEAYDGCKVDAWSAGIILFAMMYGQFPFESENRSKMFQKLIEGQYEFLDDVLIISDQAKDLISRLLDPNPSTRLSLSEAQGHEWLQDSNNLMQQAYLDDYNTFVATKKLNFKPKDVCQVDQEIVAQLILK